MSQQISLKEAEQKVFRSAYNDGLWDILLGSFFLMFVVSPYLSTSLGDFWSVIVFYPFLGLIYLAVRLLRKQVVTPRVGVVRFGLVRKSKLAKFTIIMLVINVIALILGFVAVLSFGKVPGQLYSIIFGLVLLVGFSLAAYFMDFNRLYLYGLLAGFSPPAGEWLWAQGLASHHGFPITFGTTAAIMILVGLVVFVRLLRDNPVPIEEKPSGDE